MVLCRSFQILFILTHVEPLISFCSFGMVCYDITTLRHPFGEMEQDQIVLAVLKRQKMPEFPDARPSQDLITLMGSCWHHDPARRVQSFETIIGTLDELSGQVGRDPREFDEDALLQQQRAATGLLTPSAESSHSHSTANFRRGVVVEAAASPTIDEGKDSFISLIEVRAYSRRMRRVDLHTQRYCSASSVHRNENLQREIVLMESGDGIYLVVSFPYADRDVLCS